MRQRFELPAFSTLDTLAAHVRAAVHRRLFGTVLGRLSDRQRHELDALLETDQLGRSAFNALKRSPKQPSLSHLDELVGHVRWLQEPGDVGAGRLVKQAVGRHGDVRQLVASCEAIAAYHGDNYLPLMWRFYRSHRRTLFKLAHTL